MYTERRRERERERQRETPFQREGAGLPPVLLTRNRKPPVEFNPGLVQGVDGHAVPRPQLGLNASILTIPRGLIIIARRHPIWRCCQDVWGMVHEPPRGLVGGGGIGRERGVIMIVLETACPLYGAVYSKISTIAYAYHTIAYHSIRIPYAYHMLCMRRRIRLHRYSSKPNCGVASHSICIPYAMHEETDPSPQVPLQAYLRCPPPRP